MKAQLSEHTVRLEPETLAEERWMEDCLGLPKPGDDLVQGSCEPIVIATRYHDQVYATLSARPEMPNYRAMGRRMW